MKKDGNSSIRRFVDSSIGGMTCGRGGRATMDGGLAVVSLLFFAAVTLVAFFPAVADVIHVEKTGDDSTGDGSGENPFLTVEKGVYAAKDGDTVVLGDGEFAVDGECLYVTNAITLKSVNGPSKTSVKAAGPDQHRYGMKIDSVGAVVEGVTVTGGKWSQYYGGKHTGVHHPGGLELYNGTVTNCVISGNQGGNNNAGGVYVKAGLLTDCKIHGNTGWQNGNANAGQGGGVRQTGGIVEYCEIYGNSAYYGYGPCGGAAWLSDDALMRHCTIRDNYAAAVGKYGCGVYVQGGTLEFCTITGNGNGKNTAGKGNGVYQSGGTVRSCLIAGNTANADAAGVYQDGGTMEFCTIAGNSSTSGGNGGLYLNGSKAVSRNNVIFDNGDVSKVAEANIKYVSGTYAYNASDRVVIEDAGNVAGVTFNNPGSGDYSLADGCGAIDAGLTGTDDPTADLAGNMRPKDGDGDGVAIIDMGCYEAMGADEGELRCSFSVAGSFGMESCESTFTAFANGEGSTGAIAYKWDFDNDGVYDVITDAAVFKTNFTAYGMYDVRLVVEAGGKESDAFMISGAVKVGSAVTYVNTTGRGVWPYATPGDGTNDLAEAFDSILRIDGVTNVIYIGEGTFALSEKWLNVTMPTKIIGTGGREKCIIKAAGPDSNNKRILRLADAGAWVEGVRLTGAYLQGYFANESGAAALNLEAGVVTNCVISDSQGSALTCTGGAWVKGGALVDCIVRNCHSDQGTSSGATGYGGGIRITSGLVENCIITNNYIQKYTAGDYARGGGVYIDGENATVRGCYIADNHASQQSGAEQLDFRGTQVRVSAGLLENCVIGDMSRKTVGGIPVYQNGGTIRNTLVRDAKSKKEVQAVTVTGGLFCNNTVVGNGYGVSPTSPVVASVTGGGVTNCIFAANSTDAVTVTGGAIGYSRFADASGDGNIASEVLFKNVAESDYHLRGKSPAINQGVYLDWMNGATDLDGNPRIGNGIPDMGCYERLLRGARMFIR